MKPTEKPLKIGPLGVSPIAVGIGCCIFSAFAFTAVNICLRFMSTQCDKVWVIFMKELMTVVIIGPWLLAQLFRGKRLFPNWRLLAVLAVMGLVTQWAANLPCVWAMSVVGLSVTVPVTMGTNLAVGAVLGWLLLRERITKQSMLAIFIMCLAILLLSLGASSVNESIAASTGTDASMAMIVLAVMGTAMAGTIYALLAVVIRRTVTGSTGPAIVVFIITGMGVITLGPWSLYQNGFEMVAAIPIRDHFVLLLTGALNLAGFFAVAKGLEMITVAHANVLTASQVAMGVMAGMLLFAEPSSPWLLVGVFLAIAAIITIRPAHEEEIELSTGL